MKRIAWIISVTGSLALLGWSGAYMAFDPVLTVAIFGNVSLITLPAVCLLLSFALGKRLNLTHLGCIFLLVTASATVLTAHGLNRTMEGAVEFPLWPIRAIMAMSQPVESEPEMAKQAAQELSAAAARQTKP